MQLKEKGGRGRRRKKKQKEGKKKKIKKEVLGGTWVAQWVKASAFSSGHDPRVLGSSPAPGSLLGGEPALPLLSACLSAYL